MINKKIIRERLEEVIEQKGVGIVSSIVIKGVDVHFALEFSDNTQASEELRRSCEQAVKMTPWIERV